MQKYQVLIFDADHTLLDYKADEIGALKRLFEEWGLPTEKETLEWCHFLSEQAWTEAGLYDVGSERIQKDYHRLYKSHVSKIFERFFAKYPCLRSPDEAGRKFLKNLRVGGNFFPFAEQTLKKLSLKTGGAYRVCVATNGLEDIQTGRLKGLEKYCEQIFISERVGAIKPTAAFFSKLTDSLGVSPRECLMIGDSLSSDVLGGANAGMDTCWFNSRNLPKSGSVCPTYEIEKLSDLLAFL